MSHLPDPLIQPDELAARLGESGLLICDCRHDLVDAEAGRRAYALGHVPGAHFLHLDDDLSGPRTGSNGRHPLPDPQRFAQRMAAIGLAPDVEVVAYDASGGAFAARLWWLLRWLGHDRVRVLDGGWPAWMAVGGEVSVASAQQVPKAWEAIPRPWTVSVHDVVANLTRRAFQLIDARAPGRFAGEGETLDPVAGHIPGARNRFFQLNLDGSGRFKSPEQLRAEWQPVLAGLSPDQIVHQCGSGVTACHNLLALELAGYSGSRLYPGSWSEWCSDPTRPIATGPDPG
jgi:thiosulfate/3-mercaptopyruvate sulfurtransferase